MPRFHTGGWNVLLIPFLLQSGSFTLLRKFDAEQVMQLLEDVEATLFMGVPTMLRMMSETQSFDQVKLESLWYFIVGGEAMPLPLIQLWEQKGIPVRQGFGLTEVGSNIFSLHHDDAIRKIGSIGTPNFFIEVKLVKQYGAEAGIDEEGELWLRGLDSTPGYWKNEEATREAFDTYWFKTGDILVKDSEGYYFVKDRIKNMFISGGENVYPAEVERVLQTHPFIAEVAVIGVPDPKWGKLGKQSLSHKMVHCMARKSTNITKESLPGSRSPNISHLQIPSRKRRAERSLSHCCWSCILQHFSGTQAMWGAELCSRSSSSPWVCLCCVAKGRFLFSQEISEIWLE